LEPEWPWELALLLALLLAWELALLSALLLALV
jgi:hypothetical protein